MSEDNPDIPSLRPRRVQRRIGESLMRHGKTTPQQATDVAVKQLNGDGRQFGRIAIERGYVSDEDLWEVINAEKTA